MPLPLQLVMHHDYMPLRYHILARIMTACPCVTEGMHYGRTPLFHHMGMHHDYMPLRHMYVCVTATCPSFTIQVSITVK
jgi:hypothetical protein